MVVSLPTFELLGWFSLSRPKIFVPELYEILIQHQSNRMENEEFALELGQ